SLQAASVGSLLHRIAAAGAGGGRALLLRGFDTLAPRLRSIAAARQPRAVPQAPQRRAPSAATRVLRAADAQEELERIAAWCRERVLVQPDARLLVILPGAPGARLTQPAPARAPGGAAAGSAAAAGRGTRIHRAARQRRRRARGGERLPARLVGALRCGAHRGRLARASCCAQCRPADPHALA